MDEIDMSIKKSLLSVIVPVYNTSKYLKQCIDSILNNLYRDFELILVDDGSTDDSLKICLDYQTRDSRVKVLSQENQGQSVARNTGLDIATGKYITFVDSDDWVSPDAYVENIKILENNPDIDVVQFPYIRVNEEGNLIGNICSNTQIRLTNLESLYSYWLEKSILRVYVWNKIYRRQIWTNLQFPSKIQFEDCYIMTDFIEKGAIFYLNDKGCSFYRIRVGQSTSKAKTILGLRSRFIADLHIMENLRSYNSLLHLELEKYTNCISYIKKMNVITPNQWNSEKEKLRKVSPTLREIFEAKCSFRMKLFCLWHKYMFR